MLDHPDEVAFGTAASLSASAGVQPSTLIRLAQLFGFDGFTSLQALFRHRMRGRNGSYEERLSGLRGEGGERAGNAAVLQGFLAASGKSLDSLEQSLDPAQIDRAVEMLARAETIYLLARRRSYPVANYLAYALSKLQVRNQIVDSSAGLSAETISFATPRDALLAVSFSPYTPQTIEEARLAAANGTPVVAITDSAFSPLAQVADVWFEVAEADFGGFRSLAATMALALTLAVGLAEARRRRPSLSGKE
ncbi:MAG: MurR/RpiR family transcriptional regulator [Rhizobiaceae bacterium]|nr:MurR/RpiR family transcriptional regulator [Rhizobiaceae bacterium]